MFQAIADPTRREILGWIAYESMNVNAVSGNFDVSRAAIYKHLKILTECGLVVITQKGRERYCEARLIKINFDANQQVAQTFGVNAVPTFILFKKGEILWRHPGMIDKMRLKETIERFMEKQEV